MRTRVTTFDNVKDDYPSYLDFGSTYARLLKSSPSDSPYHLQEGYLFYGNRLCISRSSLRDHLLYELHPSGVAGHYEHDKTFELAT